MTQTAEYSEYIGQLLAFIGSNEGGFVRAQSTGPAPEFIELAKKLFSLQFEHVHPYQKLCKARGITPENLKHWSEIPAVPTLAFKELEFSSIPPGERVTVFHSSGTTQQRPSRHFHNNESLAVYRASLLPWFKRHLLPEFSAERSNGLINEERPKFHILSLTPSASLAPNSSLVHMFESVIREWGSSESLFSAEIGPDGAWNLDFNKAIGTLSKIAASGQPVIILGTAFSFVHLLDSLMDRNVRLRLPKGSRALETGGYKGRSRTLDKRELHSFITDRLGIPSSYIVCEYGMSELSSQAYDLVARCRDDSKTELDQRVFQLPPWAMARIISPENGEEVAMGETGIIRIYDLANAYSVMAIQTEDLGIRRDNGFELIGRAASAEPRGCSIQPAG